MKISLFLCIATWSFNLYAADTATLKALSAFESSSRDAARGRAGEVSRYQILPTTWAEHSKIPCTPNNYQDPHVSFIVANSIWEQLRSRYYMTCGHYPTDAETYVMWNRGFNYYARHHLAWNLLPRGVRDKALRFDNINKQMHERKHAK